MSPTPALNTENIARRPPTTNTMAHRLAANQAAFPKVPKSQETMLLIIPGRAAAALPASLARASIFLAQSRRPPLSDGDGSGEGGVTALPPPVSARTSVLIAMPIAMMIEAILMPCSQKSIRTRSASMVSPWRMYWWSFACWPESGGPLCLPQQPQGWRPFHLANRTASQYLVNSPTPSESAPLGSRVCASQLWWQTTHSLSTRTSSFLFTSPTSVSMMSLFQALPSWPSWSHPNLHLRQPNHGPQSRPCHCEKDHNTRPQALKWCLSMTRMCTTATKISGKQTGKMPSTMDWPVRWLKCHPDPGGCGELGWDRDQGQSCRRCLWQMVLHPTGLWAVGNSHTILPVSA